MLNYLLERICICEYLKHCCLKGTELTTALTNWLMGSSEDCVAEFRLCLNELHGLNNAGCGLQILLVLVEAKIVFRETVY